MRAIIGLFFITLVNFASAQKAADNTDTEVFNYFIGEWVAPDSARIYQLDPSRKGKIFFSFNKGAYNRTLLVAENHSPGDVSDAIFTGMVSLNPVTGIYEFFGTNSQDGFLFKGSFENTTKSSFTRHYDVYYPKEHPIAKSAGQIISFKEEFHLMDSNTIAFDLKFYDKKDKSWKYWIPGKHVLVRKR